MSLETRRITELLTSDESLLDFCRHLPKCELHSHLTGGLLSPFVEDLINARTDITKEEITCMKNETWGDSVALFLLLNKLTSTLPIISRTTEHVVEHYWQEGVKYLELRIGIKPIPTKEQYLSTLVDTIDGVCKEKFPGIVVKLLVSVARHGEVAYAEESVNVAIDFFRNPEKGKGVVVGVDFSGNPHVGSFGQFRHVFDLAREAGLKVALHFAENKGWDDEHQSIIQFGPERVGHAIFMNGLTQERLISSHIPVEICLACHDTFYKVSVAQNPAAHFQKVGHPYILCCDNKGLYRSSLSEEYALAIKTYNLTVENLRALVLNAFDYGFASKETMQGLKKEATKYFDELIINLKLNK